MWRYAIVGKKWIDATNSLKSFVNLHQIDSHHSAVAVFSVGIAYEINETGST